MASNIESRIVSLVFDNQQFSKKAEESKKELEELDKKLEFKDADKSFKNLTKAANQVSFSQLTSSVGTVGVAIEKAMSIGAMAVQRLKDKVLDVGENIVSLLAKPITAAFEQIKNGGYTRATKIDKAKFKMAGLGVEWEQIKEDIDYGVADTQYGLDEAAMAAANLVSTGVEFGETFGEKGNSPMAKALLGISGLASTFDRTYDDIANVYQVIAAAGHVTNDSLSRFTERGIPVAERLAAKLNKTSDELQKMCKEGAISVEYFIDVMHEEFGKHAKDANETMEGAFANMNAALSKSGEKFAASYRLYMTDVYNAIRLVVKALNGADMSNLLPLIETADAIMRDLSEKFVDITDRVKKILIDGGAWADIIKGVSDRLMGVYTIIDTILTLLDPLYRAVDETVDKALLFEGNVRKSKIVDFAKKFAETGKTFLEWTRSEETFTTILHVLEAIAGAFKNIKIISKTVYNDIKDVFKFVLRIFNINLDAVDLKPLNALATAVTWFKDLIIKVRKDVESETGVWASVVQLFLNAATIIGEIIAYYLIPAFKKIKESGIISTIISKIGDAIYKAAILMYEGWTVINNFLHQSNVQEVFSNIKDGVVGVWDAVVLAKDAVVDFINALLLAYNNVFDNNVFDGVINGFNNFVSLAKEAVNDIFTPNKKNKKSKLNKKDQDALSSGLVGQELEAVEDKSLTLSEVLESIFKTVKSAMGIFKVIGDLVSVVIYDVGKLINVGKDAFIDVFGGTKTSKDVRDGIVRIVEGLSRFVNSLKLSDKAAANFKRIFRGVFTIIQIGKELFLAAYNIITTIFQRLAYDAGDSSGTIIDSISGIIAVVADWIVTLKEWLDSNNVIEKITSFAIKAFMIVRSAIIWVIEFVQLAWQAIDELSVKITGSTLKENFEKLGETVSNIWGKIKDFFSNIANDEDIEEATEKVSPFAGVWNAIKQAFETFFDFISGVWPSVEKIFDKILEVFGVVLGFVGDLLKNLNFGTLMSGAFGATAIMGAWDGTFGMVELVIKKANTALTTLRNTLVAFQKSINAGTLRKIAMAVFLMAASVVALGLLDPMKLTAGLGAISALSLELNGMAVWITSLTETIGATGVQKFKQFSKGMISMSVALLLLSIGVSKIGELDWKGLAIGLIGTIALLAALSTVALVVGSMDVALPKVGAALIAMSLALLILTIPVKIFAKMDLQQLGQGLIFVVLTLGSVVMIATGLNSAKIFVAANALLVMANAMLLLLIPIKVFGSMDLQSLGQGLIFLVLTLGSVAMIATGLNGAKIFVAALGILSLSLSVAILTSSMKKLGEMSWDNINKGLIAIAAVMAEMVTFALVIKDLEMSKAVATIFLLAAAMRLMVKPIESLSKLSVESLIYGLAAIGAILGELVIFSMTMESATFSAASITVLAFALALRLLITPFERLAAMEWDAIAKGLLTLATILAIVVVTGYAADGAAVGLLFLAASFLIISVGAIALAFAFKIIASALSLAINALNAFNGTIGEAFDIFAQATVFLAGIISITLALAALTIVGIAGIAGAVGFIALGASLFVVSAALTVVSAALGLASGVIMLASVSWTMFNASLLATFGILAQMTVYVGILTAITIVLMALSATGVVAIAAAAGFALLGLSLIVLGGGATVLSGGLMLAAEAIRAFAEAIEALVNAVSTVSEGVSSFFGGIWEGIKGLGSGIADFFSGGMTESDSIAQVQAAGYTLGDAAITGIAEGTDSHSPSVMAEEQGKNVGAGFENGLAKSTVGVARRGEGLGYSAMGGMERSIRSSQPALELASSEVADGAMDSMLSEFSNYDMSSIGLDFGSDLTSGMNTSLEGLNLSSLNLDIDSLSSSIDGLDMDSLTSDLDSEFTLTPVIDSSNVDSWFGSNSSWLSTGDMEGTTTLGVNDNISSSLFAIQENQNNDTTASEIVSLREELSAFKEMFHRTMTENTNLIVNDIGPRVSGLQQAMYNMQVVMDTNAIVGQITPKIDESLGRRANYKGRGN